MYRQDYWTCRTQKLQIYSLQANVESFFTPILPQSMGNSQGWVADSRSGAGYGSRLYDLNIINPSFGCGVTAGFSHAGLLSPRPSCSGRLPSQTLARGLQTLWNVAGANEGKITTGNEPRTRLMDLPRIEDHCCYISCYISCYIIHAIFNAI